MTRSPSQFARRCLSGSGSNSQSIRACRPRCAGKNRRLIVRIGATRRAPSSPICCGSCAPAHSRRRPKAISNKPISSLSATWRSASAIVATIPDMPWILEAPAFLVFAANGARLPALCELRGKPFPNDHLDQFFNAAVDAAIVMTTFIHAAATVGLGCCPISAIRDHPRIVSDALKLPDRVIPVAGLCVGWPAQAGEITPRLSLRHHRDRERLSRARPCRRDRCL